jgi:integrase
LLTFSLTLHPPSTDPTSTPLSPSSVLKRAVEGRIQGKKASVEALSRWRAYLGHCATHQLPATPPTYDSVSSYLCHWVTTHEGSTRTLAKVQSNVKVMATLLGHGWLSERHALQLRRLVDQLRFEDTSEARRVNALRTATINAIIDKWRLKDTPRLLEATLLKFGAQALLRGAELTSGLRASDVVWIQGSKAVQVRLLRTKCGRTGGGVFVTVAQCHDPQCGVRLLRRLWRRLGLDTQEDGLLFPAVTRGAVDPARPYAATALRQLVKRSVRQVGLDPRLYANHSLRAGGATDLLSAGVPELFVKKAGRWKSDTYQIYHREGMVVARQAARGFNKATKSKPPRGAVAARPSPARR